MLIGIDAVDYDRTVDGHVRNLAFETVREVVNENADFRLGFLDNGAFELEIRATIVRDPDVGRLIRASSGMPAEGFVKLSLVSRDLEVLADKLRAIRVKFVRENNASDPNRE